MFIQFLHEKIQTFSIWSKLGPYIRTTNWTKWLCSLQNIIWPTIFCSELSPLCINMEYLNKWGKKLWTSTHKYAIYEIMTADFFIFFRINLVFFFHSSWSYFIIDLISLINTLYEIFLEKCKMYQSLVFQVEGYSRKNLSWKGGTLSDYFFEWGI